MEGALSGKVNYQEPKKNPISAWRIMWKEVRHDKIALIGLILFVAIVTTVYIWAPLIDFDAAMRVDLRSRDLAPSAEHILGTDAQGRDGLTQLVLSARNSFNIAFLISIAGAVIGVLLGLFSGYFGGHIDNVVMRILDFFTLVPPVMLVIVFIAVMEGYGVLEFSLIMIILFSWQGTARLIRAKALQQGQLDYVSASKTLGTPNIVVIFREVLPNLISIIVSQFTIALAGNMGIEVMLTALGFGLPFGTPSLGRLVWTASNPATMVNRSWQWLPAAVLIVLMMLCINFVGQALNRAADAKKRTI